MTQKRRAQVGFLAWSLPMLACTCWLVANRSSYTKMEKFPAFDYSDPGWANGTSPPFCAQHPCLLRLGRGTPATGVPPPPADPPGPIHAVEVPLTFQHTSRSSSSRTLAIGASP